MKNPSSDSETARISLSLATWTWFRGKDGQDEFNSMDSDHDNLVRPKVFCYFAAPFRLSESRGMFRLLAELSDMEERKGIVNECFLLGRATYM